MLGYGRLPRTIAEFESKFSSEKACRDYLFRLRWPQGDHLSSVSGYQGLANQTPSVGLWRLWLPGIYDGWNHLSRYPQAAGYVVSSYLVYNHLN